MTIINNRKNMKKIIIFALILAFSFGLLGLNQALAADYIYLSNVNVNNITTSSATINWNSNIGGTSEVRYATSWYNLDYAGWTTTESYFSSRTYHNAWLSVLNASTQYFFEVRTSTASTAATYRGSFYTANSYNHQNITISNVQIQELTDDSVTIYWTSDIPGTSEFRYATSWDGLNNYSWTMAEQYSSSRYNHYARIYGLNPNTWYAYEIKTADTNGNYGTYRDSFTTRNYNYDNVVISNARILEVRDNSVRIAWNTNIGADSQVRYATSWGALDYAGWTTTESYSSSRTYHEANIYGLNPGTWYAYEIRSVSNYGVSATYRDSFTTKPAYNNERISMNFNIKWGYIHGNPHREASKKDYSGSVYAGDPSDAQIDFVRLIKFENHDGGVSAWSNPVSWNSKIFNLWDGIVVRVKADRDEPITVATARCSITKTADEWSRIGTAAVNCGGDHQTLEVAVNSANIMRVNK